MSNQQKKHQHQQQPATPHNRVPNPATRVPPPAPPDPMAVPPPAEPEDGGKMPVLDMAVFNRSGRACAYEKCGSKRRKKYLGGDVSPEGTIYRYGCEKCCRRFSVWAPAVVKRGTPSKASSQQAESPENPT